MCRQLGNILISKEGVILRYLLVFIVLLSIGSLPIRADNQVIGVDCPNSSGCFNMIREAINSAFSGNTIKLGAGTYYEKSILISKSLSLIGTGTDNTHIKIVDSGPGISIVSPNEIAVNISDLEILMPHIWDVADQTTKSIGIFFGQPESARQYKQTVKTEKIRIKSNLGIYIDIGNGAFNGKKIEINGASGGITLVPKGSVEIDLEDSEILGPSASNLPGLSDLSMLPGIGIWVAALAPSSGQLRLSIIETKIKYWLSGLTLSSAQDFGFPKLQARLINNLISFNRGTGMTLIGDGDILMTENFITANEFGLQLYMAPCFPSPAPAVNFRGKISGSKNRIQNNTKEDVCPRDYPFPNDFFAQSTMTTSNRAINALFNSNRVANGNPQ